MDAIEKALLAVGAVDDGDPTGAGEHLRDAQQRARSSARRERQIVEIAGLVVAGRRARAADLMLIHTVEFPDDAALLAIICRG